MEDMIFRYQMNENYVARKQLHSLDVYWGLFINASILIVAHWGCLLPWYIWMGACAAGKRSLLPWLQYSCVILLSTVGISQFAVHAAAGIIP